MVGGTVGGVRAVLRVEGLCVCAASILAYAKFGSSWSVFFICFLLPDVSFLGYLISTRAGAHTYNAAHSYVGAIFCLALALAWSSKFSMTVTFIWCAHIGFDRALGYGL